MRIELKETFESDLRNTLYDSVLFKSVYGNLSKDRYSIIIPRGFADLINIYVCKMYDYPMGLINNINPKAGVKMSFIPEIADLPTVAEGYEEKFVVMHENFNICAPLKYRDRYVFEFDLKPYIIRNE